MSRCTILALLSCCSSLLLAPEESRAHPPSARRSVLILNSYNAGSPWTDRLVNTIGESLRGSFGELDLFVEYMDVKRFDEPQQVRLFTAYLPVKYAGKHLDLIVATDDAALALLAGRLPDFFPSTPVVFCGVSDTALTARLDRNRFTGYEERFDMGVVVSMALRLRPATKQLFIVLDAAELTQAFVPVYHAALNGRPGVKPVFLLARQLGLAGILDRLRSVPGDSIVIAHAFNQDRGGPVVDLQDTMAAIAAAAPVPVVSPSSSVLGRGVLAANTNAGVQHGRAAAQVAARVLNGESPAAIPIRSEGGFGPVFDHAALRRWGISERQLPKHAEVINRPMGLWFHHRDFVVTTFVLIAVQLAIIGALVWNMRARRKAEDSLRRSEQRHRDMIENAIDAIYSHDLDGRFTAVNRTMTELLGYSRDELLAMRVDRVVAPEYLAAARASIARKLADHTLPPTPYEMVVVRRDGRRVWIEVATRLILENGQPRGVEGVAHDISARKNLESQLRQAQKMDALGRLAGGVAHDFNNMLTVICGYANMLIPEAANSRQRDRLELIRNSGEQAAQLTRHLLAFSRSQVADPVLVDLNHVVKDMQKMLVRLIGGDVRLTTQLDPDLGLVRGDPGQFGQVVLNLALNARDAMPGGGTLAISTSMSTRSLPSPGTPGTPVECVVLTVADSGAGMEPEVLRQAFEPFYTTKDQGKGTGLGLSVVYGVVKQFDGEISVSSEPGRGSTFTIAFPRASGSPPAEVRSPQPRSRPGQGAVLVVEDREDVRSYAASVLADAGYHVLAASSGEEALSLAGASPVQPDVLLADVIMPGMTGPELAGHLTQRLPALRVVLMSGYTAGAGHEDKYPRLLAKPFSPEALLDRIHAEFDACHAASPNLE